MLADQEVFAATYLNVDVKPVLPVVWIAQKFT